MLEKLTVNLGDDGLEFEMSGPHLSGLLGAGGEDISPRIAWSAATTPGVSSYAITVHDPDAPTSSGFWHWTIYDLPADTFELKPGAGSPGSRHKPIEAAEARNDAGFAGYVGAAPPVGHGPHRYYFRVHALDVISLGATPETTPAMVEFMIGEHELARGEAMATYEAVAPE